MDEYGADNVMPMMIMYDGDTASMKGLAEEMGLTFPILADPRYEVFDRWDPSRATPSSTLFKPGALVEKVDTTWYTDMIEDALYSE